MTSDGGSSSSSSTRRRVRQPRDNRKTVFTARNSRLDPKTLEQDSLRGFFVFFWIFLAYYALYTVYRSFKQDGVPFRLKFLLFISEDAFSLLQSDMILISSCFVCVIIQKLINAGWIPFSLSFAVQHLWQCSWFGSCLLWIYLKNWRWVQSGFFIMHAIAMLMKQHSYLAVNREMKDKCDQLKRLQARKDNIFAGNKKDKADIDEDELEDIVAEMDDLLLDLKNGTTQFPSNVTFYNFFDYLLVPTLVYELEYPRTEKFRLSYFIEKSVAILGAFFLLYITVEHYILPVLHDMPNQSFFDSIMNLLFPFMLCWFMIFFIIFEGICNAFAELTLFADRDFYDCWWNSTSFDEFARTWNKPVHEFLLRHIYLETIRNYKVSKRNATLLTFFMSSCLHELVMFVVGKKVRFYLFFFQMLQMPLIYISRIPYVRRQRLLGNCIFWFGMLLGLPLIATLYCREHFKELL